LLFDIPREAFSEECQGWVAKTGKRCRFGSAYCSKRIPRANRTDAEADSSTSSLTVEHDAFQKYVPAIAA